MSLISQRADLADRQQHVAFVGPQDEVAAGDRGQCVPRSRAVVARASGRRAWAPRGWLRRSAIAVPAISGVGVVDQHLVDHAV